MNKWNKPFAIALALCTMLFLYNICMIAREKSNLNALEIRANALRAEYEHETSLPVMASSWIKSAFDGATFGLFADEGIFEEYKKNKRWLESVTQRDAVLRTEIRQSLERLSSFSKGRTWFGALTIFTLIGYVVTRQRKVSAAHTTE